MHLNPPPPPRAGFVRQRMVLTTDSTNGGAPYDGVPGTWVSDATAPAAVSGSSVMTIAGAGPVTLAWNLAGTDIARVTIRRNGTQIGGAGGTVSGSMPLTVAAGDTIEAWFTGTWGDWYRLAANSWIEVRPA